MFDSCGCNTVSGSEMFLMCRPSESSGSGNRGVSSSSFGTLERSLFTNSSSLGTSSVWSDDGWVSIPEDSSPNMKLGSLASEGTIGRLLLPSPGGVRVGVGVGLALFVKGGFVKKSGTELCCSALGIKPKVPASGTKLRLFSLGVPS